MSGQPTPSSQGMPGAGQALQQARGQMSRAQGQLAQGQNSGARKSMQQAAQALQQAAQALQRGSGKQGQPGQPNQPNTSGLRGASGVGLPDLSAFGIDRSQYAGKTWGELPGELQTKIIQDVKAKYGDDYARMIKLYFEQIASTSRPASRQSPPAAAPPAR
jgi:hypothetical protein